MRMKPGIGIKYSRKAAFIAPLILAATLQAGVITDWTTAASTAIVTTGGKGPGASFVWFTYTSLAMYDAVNAITGQYQPFYYHVAGPPSASIDAAAAAAAHRVLVYYFPTQQSFLDSVFTASLANIPDSNSKSDGLAVGEAAA